jgi:hypothetical protein
LAENNKKPFERRFTSPVDAKRTDINPSQAKQGVNRHVESFALAGAAFVSSVTAGIGFIGWTDRRGVYVHDGVEHCEPHGTYSMCAIISADPQSD